MSKDRLNLLSFCPLVDAGIEVVGCFALVGCGYLDIGCGVGEVFVQHPSDTLFSVNTDWH